MSVVRSLTRRSVAVWIFSSEMLSSAEVASSRISTFGSLIKALAIEIRCRCPHATEGRVLIDGQDMESINLKSYRSNIAVVPQTCTISRDRPELAT